MDYRLWLRSCFLALAKTPPCKEQTNPKRSTHNSVIAIAGVPINYLKMRGEQISWLRQPRSFAKEIASTFRSHLARHLHFVASDKKGPPLPHRFFLGWLPSVLLRNWLHIKICRLNFSINLLNNLIDNAKDPCYRERIAKMYSRT